jgi:hypothetical protein
MRVKKGAAVAGAVVAGVLMVGGPAEAAPISAMAICDPGYICVYDDYNWNGSPRMYGLSDLNYDGDSFPNGVQVNDRVSSIWNRTGQWVNFYIHAGANIQDLCFQEQPGGYRADLRVEGCDNSLSSHYPSGV